MFGWFGKKKSAPPDLKTQLRPTMKDLLVARAPPWNRVAPIIIDTIVDALAGTGLLDPFIMHSMDAGLVARYEALGRENSDPTVIRAQISQILSETGNRTIPSLAKALAGKQTDAAHKALMLAGDTLEAAIAFAKNQIAAYAGMAAIYGLVGKTEQSHDWARRGLVELEEMRRTPAAQAMCESTIIPADILEQAERHLRSYFD